VDEEEGGIGPATNGEGVKNRNKLFPLVQKKEGENIKTPVGGHPIKKKGVRQVFPQNVWVGDLKMRKDETK